MWDEKHATSRAFQPRGKDRSPASFPPASAPAIRCAIYGLVSEENRFREYGITISQNLLGEWVVSSSWGRIGGPKRVKETYFASKSEAMIMAEQEANRRLLRGYQLSAFK